MVGSEIKHVCSIELRTPMENILLARHLSADTAIHYHTEICDKIALVTVVRVAVLGEPRRPADNNKTFRIETFYEKSPRIFVSDYKRPSQRFF